MVLDKGMMKMDNAYINYLHRMKRYGIGLGFIIFMIMVFLTLLSVPVDAASTFNSTLNISNVTDTSITWQYSYLTNNRPLGATFDGVIIEGWKTDFVFAYTASGLEPNTTHEFCIFGAATSNCEKGKTLESTGNKLEMFIYTYIFLFVGIILLLVSAYIKRSEPALLAGFIGFIGLGIVGNELIGTIVYALLLIVAFIMSFEST